MRTWTCAAALFLLLGACVVTGERPVTVDVLHSGGQCGGSERSAALTLIEGQAQMDDFRARIASREMGSPETRIPDAGARMAILIEMGAKPTGGYGLRLLEPAASLRDGELEIRIEWIDPLPDMLLTQAITSPCLLLEVAAADYRRIVVRDQDGNVRVVWKRG